MFRPTQPIFGRILVPVCPRQHDAVGPYVYGLARAAGGKLLFLHVDRPGDDPREVVRHLTGLRREADRMGLSASVIRAEGDPAEMIRATALRQGVDVVVLSRRRDSDEFPRILAALQRFEEGDGAPFAVLLVPSLATRTDRTDAPWVAGARPVPADTWEFGVD